MGKISNQFNIPVLLVIFRRRKEALRVMEAIARIRPMKLYISQDGPRNKKEALIVREVRDSVLSKITWKCELTVWTHEKNLGLKKHIPEAFDKFFEKEEVGIYLEDDTLPSEEFFYYQKELLEKYKYDKRIFSINGTNFYPEKVRTNDSYFLSKIGDIWGFGLWRRSWELYNSTLNDFDVVSKKPEYKNYFFNNKYKFYLETFWKSIIANRLDSWAMQLVYSAIKNNMYFITPSVNLVNNIGNNTGGSNISLQEYNKVYGNPFPLRHPHILTYNKNTDLIYFDNMLKGGWVRLIVIKMFLILPAKLKLVIKKLTSKIIK